MAAPVAISKRDNDSEKLIYAVADIDAMKAHAAQRKPEADVEIADEHPNDRKRQRLSIRLGGRSPRGPRFPGVKDRASLFVSHRNVEIANEFRVPPTPHGLLVGGRCGRKRLRGVLMPQVAFFVLCVRRYCGPTMVRSLLEPPPQFCFSKRGRRHRRSTEAERPDRSF